VGGKVLKYKLREQHAGHYQGADAGGESSESPTLTT
jgi:hypothetical protein